MFEGYKMLQFSSFILLFHLAVYLLQTHALQCRTRIYVKSIVNSNGYYSKDTSSQLRIKSLFDSRHLISPSPTNVSNYFNNLFLMPLRIYFSNIFRSLEWVFVNLYNKYAILSLSVCIFLISSFSHIAHSASGSSISGSSSSSSSKSVSGSYSSSSKSNRDFSQSFDFSNKDKSNFNSGKSISSINLNKDENKENVQFTKTNSKKVKNVEKFTYNLILYLIIFLSIESIKPIDMIKVRLGIWSASLYQVQLAFLVNEAEKELFKVEMSNIQTTFKDNSNILSESMKLIDAARETNIAIIRFINKQALIGASMQMLSKVDNKKQRENLSQYYEELSMIEQSKFSFQSDSVATGSSTSNSYLIVTILLQSIGPSFKSKSMKRFDSTERKVPSTKDIERFLLKLPSYLIKINDIQETKLTNAQFRLDISWTPSKVSLKQKSFIELI